jgi:hypothetical protein
MEKEMQIVISHPSPNEQTPQKAPIALTHFPNSIPNLLHPPSKPKNRRDQRPLILGRLHTRHQHILLGLLRFRV